ncbi:nucleotidyltransferase family protein [Paenibacillus sediminis]|uniref:Molybdenum cofactor cytidylyltransferase n=1 Tax=Paenibacillus sediminis TaxID=664909 RepID=A0ABS4H1T8_9BACL|nr:molybdenum cofactor cytidylyltransferase [Paenibacillus sediminis]
MKKINVAGLILAAGKSSRMGKDKLSIRLSNGRCIGEYAVREALRSSLDHIYVVTKGIEHPIWLISLHNDMEDASKLTIVPCAEAERGMAFSIRGGMKRVLSEQADAVMIILADQPHINAQMIDQIIQSYMRDSKLDFVAASDNDVAKPPVLFPKHMYKSLMVLEGDQGARKLLQSSHFHGRLINFPAHYFVDVDVPGDIDLIERRG